MNEENQKKEKDDVDLVKDPELHEQEDNNKNKDASSNDKVEKPETKESMVEEGADLDFTPQKEESDGLKHEKVDELEKKKGSLKTKIILAITFGVLLVGICIFVYAVTSGFVRSRNFEVITLNETINPAKEKLTIHLPSSDIQVTGTDSNEISLNLTGPDYLIEKISIGDRFGSSSIQYNQGLSGFTFGENQISGEIFIPESIKLDLVFSGNSNVKISNVDLELELALSGSSNLNITDSIITDFDGALSGDSIVNIDNCRREFELRISGSSEFKADSCDLDNFYLTSSGSSKVEILDGIIENASINTSGASYVQIPEVRNRLQQDLQEGSRVEFNQ